MAQVLHVLAKATAALYHLQSYGRVCAKLMLLTLLLWQRASGQVGRNKVCLSLSLFSGSKVHNLCFIPSKQFQKGSLSNHSNFWRNDKHKVVRAFFSQRTDYDQTSVELSEL